MLAYYAKISLRSLSEFCTNYKIAQTLFCITTFKNSAHVKPYSSKTASKTVSIPTSEYKLHNLEEGPAKTAEVTTEDARIWLTKMVLIRKLEKSCAALYKRKIILGFCHLYSGQEAVAVGVYSLLNKNDALITAYRCHGWAYLSGITPYKILAELTGKETGNSRGKGGSMHLYAKNFYGGNGIVGAQIPIGTGVALRMKYLKEDSIMVALYGDGAANQGQIFEAFNIAKLWSLPIIYICENNLYSMGTSNERSAASTQYYTRGDYIPGIFVNGMSIISVREATKFAINYVKSGKGPIIMEMNTYRYHGHSMSDPGTSYRTRDEVTEIRKTRDPITKFKEMIAKYDLLSEEEIKKIENETKIEIDEATKKAVSDKVPKAEALITDVYMKVEDFPVRMLDPWTVAKYKNHGKLP